MASHTLGPWVANAWADNGDVRINHADRPFVIASAHNAVSAFDVLFGRYPAEQWANANLIAAAPQMLEALKRLIAPDGGEDDDILFARAVIAAATGVQS